MNGYFGSHDRKGILGRNSIRWVDAMVHEQNLETYVD